MLDPGHVSSDAHASPAGVDLPGFVDDLRAAPAGITPGAFREALATLPPTIRLTTPGLKSSAATISDPGHSNADALEYGAGADPSTPGHCRGDNQTMVAGGDLHDAILSILAASLDDLERTRIATQNRIRALRDDQGLAGSPFDAKLTALLEGLETLEHQATLDLQRAMRMHPLHAFVKQTRGLGEKQAARLLAAIGDPAARENPAKLWQYAGHGDPARSRKRKGQTVEFNPTAKMRVHLCAESMLRSGNREVYDAARAAWADRDTTDGHKHNHALRLVGKRLLLDMWKAARADA